MFANLVLFEHRKTFGRRIVWILAGAAAVFVMAMLTLGFVTRYLAASRGLDGSGVPDMRWPNGMLQVLNQFLAPGLGGGILVIVLTAILWAEEYRWRTLQLWLSRGISRTSLIGAQFLALLLPVALILVVGTAAGAGTSLLFTVLTSGNANLVQVSVSQIVLSIVRLWAAALPVAALTLLFGVLTRSTAGALGAALGYLMLGEEMLRACSGSWGSERACSISLSPLGRSWPSTVAL